MFGVRQPTPGGEVVERLWFRDPSACEVLQEGEGAPSKWDGESENGKEVQASLHHEVWLSEKKKKVSMLFMEDPLGFFFQSRGRTKLFYFLLSVTSKDKFFFFFINGINKVYFSLKLVILFF